MTRYRLIRFLNRCGACNPIPQDNAPEDLLPPEPARVTEPLPDYTRDAPRPHRSRAWRTVSTTSACLRAKWFSNSRAVGEWDVAQAKQLLAFIPTVAAEGLVPSDYREALSAAIAQGPGTTLNETASEIFVWLVEDLRDGRTPMDARRQWFVVDPDPTCCPRMRCSKRRSQAATSRSTLAGLNPVSPDYARLKEELARTTDRRSAS